MVEYVMHVLGTANLATYLTDRHNQEGWEFIAFTPVVVQSRLAINGTQPQQAFACVFRREVEALNDGPASESGSLEL